MHHNTTRAGLFGRTIRGHTVLAISGELDIATTAVLRDRIAAVLDDTVLPVIIDLSRVSFCDASGLTMLVALRQRADAHGRAVALSGPRPNVCKLLRITGLDRVFPIYSTLAQAVLGRVDAHGPAVAGTSVAKAIGGCRTTPARRDGG
jgi:anti-anti-sigma factor